MAGRTSGWQRSSRCESSSCVEVLRDVDAQVRVRHSRHPDLAVRVAPAQWRAFCEAVKRGNLGAPQAGG
jgi:hypothetical protein